MSQYDKAYLERNRIEKVSRAEWNRMSDSARIDYCEKYLKMRRYLAPAQARWLLSIVKRIPR